MFAFLKRLFGPSEPRPKNAIPAGVRDVVAFAWSEPEDQGQPSASDIARLAEALGSRGWGDVQAVEMGYAVEFEGQREETRLGLAVGFNGDGPWVAFVELWALEEPAKAAQWVRELHDMLAELGGSSFRWYERLAHGRGDGSDPWPLPTPE